MAPAGIRLAGGEPERTSGLVYADAGDLDLEAGDWVVVGTAHGERVGVVRITPRQVVESALAGPLLPLIRHARPDERPVEPSTAGAALLRSLKLPALPGDSPAAYEESGLASGPSVADEEGDGGEDEGECASPD